MELDDELVPQLAGGGCGDGGQSAWGTLCVGLDVL